MSTMTMVGIVCWIIACTLGMLYQYETRNVMALRGMILKGLAAFSVVAYAIVLIAMFGHTTDASIDFVIGLVLVSIADVLIAYLEYIGNGSSESLLQAASGDSNAKRIILSFAGILFVISFFLQMVAFIKGISHYATPKDYVVTFAVFIFVPPIFTALGIIVSRFKIPEIDSRVFIIGAFFILLASALFAAASVFAFSMFPSDSTDATWVFFGNILFFLSILMVELRYANPRLYDIKSMRITSRLLTFLGRMILAGCAFLF